ncbi:MAG TPA: mandelate racemase/muconate lactonizing enzyme family protein [Bryobacterales bacterium]|nr:mandelate racemase/muconate lactonizing enzyme family protein [Bryobacterales bacterium]
MKITSVEALHLRLPNVEEIADGTQDVLVIRISTDAGLTGIGEVSSQSYVCKAIFEAGRSAERRHGLAYILQGQDPLDVEGLWQRMYYHTNRYGRRGAAIHAISGADIALWDLKGKALGKPVCELLGGSHRESVRAYASYLFGATPQETADLASQAVDLGLTAAKFGWGPFGKDLAADVAHVEAARRALGDVRGLMVDAGCVFTVDSALERAQRLAPYGIGWLEEPLSQDDLKGYAALCAHSAVPIAAGEGCVTHWDFENLIGHGLHVIQPDVAICGGLTVARQASQLAQAAGRRAVPHCFSTGINLAASLHWMAAHPPGDLVEYCLRPSPLMRKLVRNLPPLVDGRVPVPAGPGLGIELDEDIIEQYRVP